MYRVFNHMGQPNLARTVHGFCWNLKYLNILDRFCIKMFMM